MMPFFRSCRAVPLFVTLALLAGCAAQPSGAELQPTPLNTLTITPSDLQKVRQEAYNQGFEAGRHYQQKRDGLQQDAGQPDTQPPDVQTQPLPGGKDGSQADCQPQAAQPTPQAPIPPLPPSASYTSSGPAKPLQQ